MTSQYRDVSSATVSLTFANKEYAGPERGIAWGETNKHPLWTSLLESSAGVYC